MVYTGSGPLLSQTLIVTGPLLSHLEPTTLSHSYVTYAVTYVTYAGPLLSQGPYCHTLARRPGGVTVRARYLYKLYELLWIIYSIYCIYTTVHALRVVYGCSIRLYTSLLLLYNTAYALRGSHGYLFLKVKLLVSLLSESSSFGRIFHCDQYAGG